MTVPDSLIVKNIILSFYGESISNKDWRYCLKEIAFLDYLLINPDLSKLHDLEIPAEGFNLLIDTIDRYIGYTDEMIDIINSNIPDNYDLSKFPKELINKMIDHCYTCMLVSGSYDCCIKAWDLKRAWRNIFSMDTLIGCGLLVVHQMEGFWSLEAMVTIL